MNEFKKDNIYWSDGKISRMEREELHGHRGFTLWFTGLSASGKSTIANAVEDELWKRKCSTYLLDGDNIRHGLNKNLSFSPADREENIRRISEVAGLFRDAGIINLVAFISPYLKDRQLARQLDGEGDAFIEVFVDCTLKECEARDPKGMYKKARAGVIPDFTGISAPYEVPNNPEIHLHTDKMDVNECVLSVMDYLFEHSYLA